MKKVLLIADSNMSLSGVPVVFMSIVKNLHPDYIFDIIVLKDNDMYFEKEFLSFGGKVFRFNCPKPESFFKKLKWLIHDYPKQIHNFCSKTINLTEYVAVHSFQELFSYPFFKEAKKAGIKKLILQICSATSAYPMKKTFSQAIANSYQMKAKILSTTIAFVSEKSLELNDYKNKGVVLYNIYDENKFGHIRECKHNNLVLTQIGTFSSRKNQLFSLDLIKKIKTKYPSVILNIIGKEIEPGYLDRMNSFIKENDLDKNVVYYSGSSDRELIDQNTSYYIYPSTMESFGLILIEAQACGIHCFANATMPHDADMGNVDFIKLDVDLWSEKITSYFNAHQNARKQPINKEKFSVSQFVETLEKIY